MSSISSEETWQQRSKVILALAIPAIIEHFFQTIIGFVDTLFISRIGLVEVSAVGITNIILQVYFAIFMSIGIATNVFIAKQVGAKNLPKARQYAQQAVLLAIVVGLFLGVVTLLFAPTILSLMGADPAVLQAGTIYFKIVAIPSIFISLMFVLGSILRGTGDTKTPMKVSIWINVIHVGLDYILIFGFLFIPALGIIGAALATVIVRIIGVILLWRYMVKSEIGAFAKGTWRFSKRIQLDLLHLGWPAAGERLVMRLGQVLYFGFVLQLGTNTFAAHQIAGSIEVFSYMVGYGLATAATTLVGLRLGAGNVEEAKAYGKQSMYIAVGIMILLGGFMFLSAEWLGRFFTTDPAVIAEIRIALQINAFIQPILAVVIVLTGVFQAGGNSKFPMYITAIGTWGIRTLGVYLLAIFFGLGIAGVWIAIGLDNLFRAVWLCLKFHKGGWFVNK